MNLQSACWQGLNLLAFYRFGDKEFEKYKQVVFIGQKRVSIGLYRKEYEEWMIANPGAPLVDIPYIPKDPATRMEVPVSLESEIELFTTKEFDEAIYFIIRVPWCQCLKKLCRPMHTSRSDSESR